MSRANGRSMSLWRRLTVLLLIVLSVWALSFFKLPLYQYVSLDSLREHHHLLKEFADTHASLVFAVYFALYVCWVAVALPGAYILTIAGGFIYGALSGAMLATAFAALGSLVPFLATRTFLEEPLRKRAGNWFERFEAGFQRNAFSYLLAARLSPAIPLFVTNIVPGLLGVSTRTYLTTTILGLLLPSLAFSHFGSGLEHIFATEKDVRLIDMLSPKLIVGLAGLSLLCLAHPLWHYYTHRKSRGTAARSSAVVARRKIVSRNSNS